MPEPTVLDYVKEKLTFWKKGSLQIPSLEESRLMDGWTAEQPALYQPEISKEPSQFVLDLVDIRLPWRALIALVLAFSAQVILEHSRNQTPQGDWALPVGDSVSARGRFIEKNGYWRILPEDVPWKTPSNSTGFFVAAAAPILFANLCIVQ